ncbi:MAG: SDR family NAD-dependent epimerase/dehydratase, partial [Sphingobacteriales bacterium]
MSTSTQSSAPSLLVIAGGAKYAIPAFLNAEGIFIDGPVDFILHFASPASPVDYLEF